MENFGSKGDTKITDFLEIKDDKKVLLKKHDINKNSLCNNILSGINIEGFIKIYDSESGNIILDKKNAIHFENMSVAIVKSLISNSDGNIYSMAFGNGGTVINATGDITYMTPNTKGAGATLYNQTYIKNNITGLNETYDANNTTEANHINGTTYSDIIITCTLGYNEPTDQSAFDNNSGTDKYTFSELGIVSKDGKLLTHVIFSPISKSLNRSITIEYTIRISIL